jgi:hypothetical protein
MSSSATNPFPRLRKICVVVFSAACLVIAVTGVASAQTTPKKTPPSTEASKSAKSAPAPRSAASKSSSATSGATKSASAKNGTAKGTSKTSATASAKSNAKNKKQPVAARSWVQTQPSPGRYKEIQQALTDKGYFRGNPDGNWGPDSVDALKRFQKDQSLEEDGKIGSLSLIALGLGPKRGTQAATVQQPPAANPPEQ